MSISVDQTKATKELADSLFRAQTNPSISCEIQPAVDFVLSGKNCLTYRYILFTALAAKTADDRIDILSLQASDETDGSYDARSFCKHVIFPFQREFLDDVLDGSNEDPLVNNPGRHPRLSVSNKSANGDPSKALNLLCKYLPLVDTQEKARECLDYFITRCLEEAERKREQASSFEAAILTTNVFEARTFMSDLLDKNFGGSSLLLVANSIFSVLFPKSQGYSVAPHPVNQSGASSRQIGDLDIYLGKEKLFLVIELKDKPFTETEVRKAAQAAHANSAPAMLFIAGRASALNEETHRYFNQVKAEYENKGMVIGVMTIDALMDFFFVTNHNIDSVMLFDLIRTTMTEIKASPETMRWVYGALR